MASRIHRGPMFHSYIKNVWFLRGFISKRRKLQYIAVFFLMIISAFAEVLTLGSVVPFIAILVNPDTVTENAYVRAYLDFFALSESNDLRFFFTALFCVAAFVAASIKLLLIRFMTWAAYLTGAEIGGEIFNRHLRQPYEEWLQSNSSDVTSAVARKVDAVVSGVLLPCLQISSSLILSVFVFSLLLFVDSSVTLYIISTIGSFYIILTILVRKILTINAKKISLLQIKIFKNIKESNDNFRYIKLQNLSSFYHQIYKSDDLPLRIAQGNNVFISQFPRYLVEAAAMIFVAILAYLLINSGVSSHADPLPLLATFALGGQRLMPALQQAYASWSSIVGNSAILGDTVRLLGDSRHLKGQVTEGREVGVCNPSWSEIEFSRVSFSYLGESKPSLDEVSLKIKRGEIVGIIGETGAGKSTVTDLLLGLITPTEGELRVDGLVLDRSNAQFWQADVASVPQKITLTDSSFASNIAFGVPENEIKMDDVVAAARMACIDGFIEGKTGGFEHVVGEEGARISGGQRQRIGLARALYRNAKLLVLDEATSALDLVTEKTVVDNIMASQNRPTIIMVAHRLETLKQCDVIFEFSKGRLLRGGSYHEIIGASSE